MSEKIIRIDVDSDIDKALKVYPSLCGEVLTRKATPEEIKRYDRILAKVKQEKDKKGKNKISVR